MSAPFFTSPLLQTGTDGNILSGIAPQTVPAPQNETVENAVSSGDAFLQLLNTLRSEGTSKTADALYGKISARAEKTAPNVKTTPKGEKVRVVKLHLKRTRSSETMAKADAVKNTDRQKIPSVDRQSPALAAQSAESAPLPDKRQTEEIAAFEQTQIEETVFSEKKDPLKTEDMTAADILLMSALAPVQPARTTPEPTTAGDIPTPDETADDSSSDTVFRPRQTALPSEKETPDAGGERIENKGTPAFESGKDVLPEEKKTLQADTDDNGDAAAVPFLKEIKTTAAPEAAKPVYHEHAEKTDTREVRSDRFEPMTGNDNGGENGYVPETQKTDDRAETKTYSSGRAERQAAMLAKKLPAETVVAVHVEIEKPVFSDRPETAKKRSLRGKTADVDVKPAETETPTAGNAVEEPSGTKAEPEKTIRKAVKNDTDDSLFRFSEKPVEETASVPEQPAVAVEAPAAETTETPTTAPVQTVRAEGMTALDAPVQNNKGKAASAAAPAPKTPTPANELIDQIKVKLSKAVKEGIDKIEIVLKPKELGTIRVRLFVGEDGKTTVSLTAANKDTLELLQKESTFLKQALTDAGMNLSDGAFTFSNPWGQSAAHEDKKSARFLHSNLAEEPDELSAEEIPPSVSGNHALNIKV